MGATTAPIEDKSSSSPSLRVTKSPYFDVLTGMTSQPKDSAWRSTPALNGTNAVSQPDAHVVVPRKDPIDNLPNPVNEKRNYVNGVISNVVGDGLVECIAKAGNRDLVITLPFDCFDMPIEFGQPFRLTMEQRDGFRVPKATAIDPTPLTDADLAFVAALEADTQKHHKS